jgi:hypothetical protein
VAALVQLDRDSIVFTDVAKVVSLVRAARLETVV